MSSHDLPALESTHKHALGELASVLRNGHREEQARLFERLIGELFECRGCVYCFSCVD